MWVVGWSEGACICKQISKAKHGLGQMSDAVKMRYFGSLYIYLCEEKLIASQKMTLRGTNTTKDAENT